MSPVHQLQTIVECINARNGLDPADYSMLKAAILQMQPVPVTSPRRAGTPSDALAKLLSSLHYLDMSGAFKSCPAGAQFAIREIVVEWSAVNDLVIEAEEAARPRTPRETLASSDWADRMRGRRGLWLVGP